MSNDADMQARVALLAKSFQAKLPARFAQMNAAFAQCTVDGASDEHWIELHRLLHSLSGAAGTFGMAALGEQASVIEHRIKDKLESHAWQAGDLDTIGTALQLLQSPPTN